MEESSPDNWTPPLDFDGYRVQGLLGRGGMGAVYLGHDTLLDRPVAIKFIYGAHVGARDMFLNEARAAGRLQHPNVVSIYRVGETGGQPYIVSEYIRGQSLDRVPRPMPWKRVLDLGIGLSRGLAAAHRRGILHRDLKPSNAIQGPDGEVKLLDFGLAKVSEVLEEWPTLPPADETTLDEGAWEQMEQSLTVDTSSASAAVRAAYAMALPQNITPVTPSRPLTPLPVRPMSSASNSQVAPPSSPPTPLSSKRSEIPDSNLSNLKGTPIYMAPEVLRGEMATKRSDVYSLGALLFALCSKGPPFRGLPFPDLVRVANESDAPPLRKVAPDVDPAFAAIIDRCLRRDAEQRFASAEELREALEELHDSPRGAQLPEGNPYRGLLPFEAEHRSLFFGRQAEIGTLVERLRTEPSILVVADSGIGKSSLIRAGVIPALCEGVLEPARTWRQATIVPGRHPQAALQSALSELLGVPASTIFEKADQDPRQIGRALAQLVGANKGAVLFVDQLEELVTLSAPQEAAWVAEALGSLHGSVSGFRLLMTARADYLSRLGTLPGLGEEITRAFYLLRPLAGERLREVIVGPARRKGVAFESDELVAKLVESTSHTDSGLPLLQFALTELWEMRVGGVITARALDAMGGVEGALARHADMVLGRLPTEQRTTARRMLLALVTLEGTRARRNQEELLRRGPAARDVLEALVRSRLLVVRQTAEGPIYEVAHEALIRGWGTLRRWLEEYQESLAVRHRLESSSAEWLRLNKSSDVLWGVQQLTEVKLLEEAEIGPRDALFIAASHRALRRRQQARRALFVLIPLSMVIVYAGYQIKQRRDLNMRIEAQIREFHIALEKARNQNQEVEKLRKQAFAAFDQQKRDEGEAKWTVILEKSAEADDTYGRAAQALDAALTLDGRREDIRAQLADLLYERALLAERDRNGSRLKDLLARLVIYDLTGQRIKRWNAPAHIELGSNPSDAAVSVARYQATKRKRLELVEERKLGTTPIANLELAPGSYLLTLQAPGRVEVRYPILTRRGETLKLNLDLPDERKIPPRFVYIPPGRFLFGTAADEDLRRGFLTDVPVHEVHTDAYLIGRFELTYEEWIEYLSDLPAAERAKRSVVADQGGIAGSVGLRDLGHGKWLLTMKVGDSEYRVPSDEKLVYKKRKRRVIQNWLQLPAGGITQDDADAYIAWLANTGRLQGAHICSEEEWERAAKGADAREFPHGEVLEPDDANYDETYDKDPAMVGPDEVGAHPLSVSPFGLHDMAGNVAEIVRSTIDPREHVVRSGGFFLASMTDRTTNRMAVAPSFRDPAGGLRVCAAAPR